MARKARKPGTTCSLFNLKPNFICHLDILGIPSSFWHIFNGLKCILIIVQYCLLSYFSSNITHVFNETKANGIKLEPEGFETQWIRLRMRMTYVKHMCTNVDFKKQSCKSLRESPHLGSCKIPARLTNQTEKYKRFPLVCLQYVQLQSMRLLCLYSSAHFCCEHLFKGSMSMSKSNK